MEIMCGSEVRDTIVVHDLGSTELEIRRIDLASKEIVNRACTCKDLKLEYFYQTTYDRLAFDLNGPLTKTNEIRPNTCN